MARTQAPNSRREKLREVLWPGSSAWIWDPSDTAVKGYRPVSRLMPWILSLINELAGKTGDPGPVYFELICRDFGQGLVEIDDEYQSAFAAGYASVRGVRTWKTHMRKLVELGFILAKPAGTREFAKVLILHPLAVCARHRLEGKVSEEWWTSFIDRALKIEAEVPNPQFLPNSEGEPKRAT